MRTVKELQERLRAIQAAYEAVTANKSHRHKRLAKIKALEAFISFLMDQPGYTEADSNQLYRMAEALANLERGTPVDWCEVGLTNRPAVSIRVRRKQAEAGRRVEELMNPTNGNRKLSRREAATKVLKEIPANSSLLKGSKVNWKTVARWRDEQL